jgi:hypothetical protein
MVCSGMNMEAGLSWHRSLPSGMFRYKYGGWIELAKDYLVVCSSISIEVGLNWYRELLVVCSGMSMEAGLNWHRALPSGMFRYASVFHIYRQIFSFVCSRITLIPRVSSYTLRGHLSPPFPRYYSLSVPVIFTVFLSLCPHYFRLFSGTLTYH